MQWAYKQRQAVWLEQVPAAAHIASMHTVADVKNPSRPLLLVDAVVAPAPSRNPSGSSGGVELTLSVQVRIGDRVVAAANSTGLGGSLSLGRAGRFLPVRMPAVGHPDFRYWSPDTPFL